MQYLLTVSRTDFSRRRARWTTVPPSSFSRPRIKTIGSPELPLAYPGLLALIDEDGLIVKSIPLWGPKGLLYNEDRLLVACFTEIRSFSMDLSSSFCFATEMWFNDLHSLRPSSRGVLVAATGVDVAAELSTKGKTLWQWWAAENGFLVNAMGEPWSLGKNNDHRKYSYDIELQLTHLNCIAALDDSTIVATFFHQNALVSIDRVSGDWSVILDGLVKPHAVRVLGDGLITVADTTNGTGILLRVCNGRSEILNKVSINTTWLHDAFFDGNQWLLVDGANSRVVHTDVNGNTIRVDRFDSEWCLYEVLPWKSDCGVRL